MNCGQTAHPLQAQQEVGERPLVLLLRRKLPQRERDRLRIRLQHDRHLLGGPVAAQRLAGDLHDEPVADRAADRRRSPPDRPRRRAGGRLRVAHVQMDHGGADLEALGGGARELLGRRRQPGMVGLGLAPAVRRDRDRHSLRASPVTPPAFPSRSGPYAPGRPAVRMIE